MTDPKLVRALASFAARSVGKVELAGRSMEPLLRAGMVADVEALTRAPKPGEILVFRSPAGLTAHRLIRRSADGYVTCGDACPESPEWVREADVIGRVRAVWSDGGRAARRVDGPLFALAGRALATTRPLRGMLRVAARAGRLLFAAPPPAAAFRSLVAMSVAFESGDLAGGAAALAAADGAALAEVVRRHGMLAIVRAWLDAAAADGIPLEGEAPERLRAAASQSHLDDAALGDSALDAHARVADADRAAEVADNMAAALATAYRARDFRRFCDVVALSRALETLSAAERVRFAGYVASETADSVRLRSAVAAAECLRCETPLAGPVAAYLSWVVAREDLPPELRTRASLVDSLHARTFSLRGTSLAHALATPLILRSLGRGAALSENAARIWNPSPEPRSWDP